MGEYIGFNYFFDASERIFWVYILSAFLISLGFLYFAPKFFKEQFSSEILWHKSARLDYLYFLISVVLKVAFLIPLLVGVYDVSLWLVLKMQVWFGYFERVRVHRETLLFLFTLTLFLVNDFTRYWLHRFMHIVPLLWRFHRIHHSAEVLNPLTFYRIHPVESFLFGLRYSFSVGGVTAVFIYFFGAGFGMIEILGVSVFVFIFSLLGANLRHSHIPLRYGKSVEKWLISPYQHQLHHTKEFTHKNFGSYLSVWDRMFGTLEIVEVKKREFGLKDEKVTHSLFGLFMNPFIKGVKL
jgi:sterol desaturase/sphingolipid hydroxylase (fatty acid hydroxylase superfamily)